MRVTILGHSTRDQTKHPASRPVRFGAQIILDLGLPRVVMVALCLSRLTICQTRYLSAIVSITCASVQPRLVIRHIIYSGNLSTMLSITRKSVHSVIYQPWICPLWHLNSEPDQCKSLSENKMLNCWNDGGVTAIVSNISPSLLKSFHLSTWESYCSCIHVSGTSPTWNNNKTEVESVQLGNTYIADMDKCPQDKWCLDKCRGDSFNLLYMFPDPLFKVWSKSGQ